MNLYGDLRGRTDDGYRVSTEHIVYHQKEGFFETEEPVQISGPAFSLTGRGLYFNPEKKMLRVTSGVTTTVHRDLLT